MDLNATILGQALSFIFFVWFCMKYIWPPIILAIETRQEEVRKSLKSAKKAKEDLHLIRKNISEEIQASKEKARMIIHEANQQKSKILEKAKKQSVEVSKSIILKTRTNLEIEVIEARKN
ncbi:MAG: F0F1 ATP synthase subunit B, partial [Buchnera aphidicola]|nr:F0F1 ATP synthase subunit B [Buchnera aphidicola]